VEEILVSLPGGLSLDDLPLLPRVVDLHRDPADAGALGEHDAEGALQHAVLRVIEDEADLREGEGPLDHAASVEGGELEPRAVGGREGERRLRRGGLRGGLAGETKEGAGLGETPSIGRGGEAKVARVEEREGASQDGDGSEAEEQVSFAHEELRGLGARQRPRQDVPAG
jgi:hypothetical protein